MPSINDVKGILSTRQPLLVAAIVLKDSIANPTTLLYSTHELNTLAGGVQPTGITGFPYNNRDFQGRIANQNIATTQALSAEGIDITPTVTLDLLDADKVVWATERDYGIKGAAMTLFFIFWDAYTNSFCSDYRTIFKGICNPAKEMETQLSITATSKLNMNQIFLPITRIQKRCPWIFPDITNMTLADATALHQLAADDPSSDFYNCGYSFLASGGNAIGNKPSGDIAYRSCNYTRDTCIQNMGDPSLNYTSFAPIEKDTAGRPTARYGGVTWDQPNSYVSRGYGQNKSTKGFNAVNESKYNDYVPIGWGTYWVDPVVLNISGDANFTTMDVLLGHGQIKNIRHVICNDIDVDAAGPTGPSADQIALQLFWQDITSGKRTGACNRNQIQKSHGDPYGGLKVIEVHVPSQLTPTSSIPRIRVLLDGPIISKYQGIASISVVSNVCSVTVVGANNDIAAVGGDPFPITISGNSYAPINANFANGLTNFTTGSPGTFVFPCPGVANGTGTGGMVRYGAFTSNPAWILMDALYWIGWTSADLNIQTFMDAAAYYDGIISYNGISGFVNVASDGVSVTWKKGNDFSKIVPGENIFINGVPKVVAAVTDTTHFTITNSFGGFLNNVTFLAAGANTHARFKLGLSFTNRISGTEVIRQIRMACRSILIPDQTTGLLKLIPKRGLAEQQPAAVAGSNFNTQISSYNSAGQVAGGYVAWRFTYGDILQNPNGDSSLQIDQLDIKSSPNKVSIQFTDEDNQFQEDSITIVDSQDVHRVERPVEGSISAAGLMNFDQAQRVIEVWLAENSRGNSRFDSGGTFSTTLKSTFRCQHLSVGDIVLIDYPQLAISSNLKDMTGATINGWLARVTSIRPSTNFETVTITLQYHDDGWYVDTFGQDGINVRQLGQFRNSLNRPPFPWSPYQVQPLAGDPLYALTDWQMGVQQEYSSSTAPGAFQPLTILHTQGNLPINVFAGVGMPAPSVAAQGTTASTGGTIKAGRTYFAQLCCYDSTGKITNPSNPNQPCTIAVPAGANTATITVPVDSWPSNTVGYELFVGVLRAKTSSQIRGYTISASTRYYKVTALDASGQTVGSPEATAVCPANSQVQLTWGAVTGATSYRIYVGSAAGAENIYYTSTTNSYIDSGIPLPLASVPPPNPGYPALGGVPGVSSTAIATPGAITATIVGLPASITLTQYKEDTWGIPDVEFNSMSIRFKRCIHAGTVGAQVLSVTSTTITLATLTGEPFTTNQFAPDGGGNPYYIMLVGLIGDGHLPVVNWAIASNAGSVFTLAGGSIDPTTVDRGDGTTGIKIGDVIILTMRPTVGSDAGGNYVQDTNWNNALNPLLTAFAISAATNASPIVVTTTADPGAPTGTKVYISGVTGNTATNGVRYVTRLTATTYALYSDAGLVTPVAGSGAYISGGVFQQQDQGLVTNQEVGRELYCILGKGAGTWYKIISNTIDKIYIDGDWKVTPDATSVFIVNVPSWEQSIESDIINNSTYLNSVDFTANVPNYFSQVMFVQAFSIDGGGNESFRAQNPWRLIWIFGAPGNVFGPSGISSSIGLVPAPGITPGTSKFLREDGTWASSASGSSWKTEIPAGALDGINVTFTLVNVPFILLLYLNGVFQHPGGIDYTLSGQTITFAAAPHVNPKQRDTNYVTAIYAI